MVFVLAGIIGWSSSLQKVLFVCSILSLFMERQINAEREDLFNSLHTLKAMTS
jgi:hypothetical protein